MLNGKNNTSSMFVEIANDGYTHLFTSLEIALSKMFKRIILNRYSFIKYLYLLIVNKIHLVEEWGKDFRPMYTKIKKVQKKILYHIPLLGVLVTSIKGICIKVLGKADFLPNYCLFQTSFDCLEIMQIDQFMKYPRSSFLDLQFVPLPKANDVKDI